MATTPQCPGTVSFAGSCGNADATYEVKIAFIIAQKEIM